MNRWLLPEDIADVLPAEARKVETLRRAILDLYQSYGYELVAPPRNILWRIGRRLILYRYSGIRFRAGREISLQTWVEREVFQKFYADARKESPRKWPPEEIDSTAGFLR